MVLQELPNPTLPAIYTPMPTGSQEVPLSGMMATLVNPPSSLTISTPQLYPTADSYVLQTSTLSNFPSKEASPSVWPPLLSSHTTITLTRGTTSETLDLFCDELRSNISPLCTSPPLSPPLPTLMELSDTDLTSWLNLNYLYDLRAAGQIHPGGLGGWSPPVLTAGTRACTTSLVTKHDRFAAAAVSSGGGLLLPTTSTHLESLNMPITVSAPAFEFRAGGFGVGLPGGGFVTIPLNTNIPAPSPAKATASRKVTPSLAFGRVTRGVSRQEGARVSLAQAQAMVRGKKHGPRKGGKSKKPKTKRGGKAKGKGKGHKGHKSTSTSTMAIVGRSWPPESIKTKLESHSTFKLDNYANDSVSFALFMVGTALDNNEMTIWDGNLSTGAARSRTAAIPRSYGYWTDHYAKYRILKVEHHIMLNGIPTATTFDLQCFHWKSSIDHRDQPITVNASTVIGSAAPYDGEQASIQVENYRYTKPVNLFRHGGGSKNRVKYDVRPYIFKDGAGQRTTDGKFNTDAGGIGAAVTLSVATTNAPVGIKGYDIIMVQDKDHVRGTWVDVTVNIKTVYTIEFLDRKVNTNVQSGGIF